MWIKNLKNNKAFTLIEFIIVMAIIGILVLLASPKFLDYINKAKLTQIINDSKVAENYITTHKAIYDTLPKGKNINKDELTELVKNKTLYFKGDIIKDLNNFSKDDLYLLDKDNLVKEISTKLKGDFIYTDSGIIYVDNNSTNLPDNSENNDKEKPKPNGGVWDKYKTELNGNNITVLGFNEQYDGDKTNIEDMIDLESNNYKITRIENRAFMQDIIKGKFPYLKHVEYIGGNAFTNSNFEGDFPILENVEIIGVGAFSDSIFTGSLKLPKVTSIGLNNENHLVNGYAGAFLNSNFHSIDMPYIEIIGDDSFKNSIFLKNLKIPNIKVIGKNAFINSRDLNGPMPDMNNIKRIDLAAFKNARFTGEPNFEELEFVGVAAFLNSSFTGNFYAPNLTIIGAIKKDHTAPFAGAFEKSNFTEINIKNARIIGDRSFNETKSLTFMPNISSAEGIGRFAFYEAQLNTNFPNIENLVYIQKGAFSNSNFKNIPNDWYKGWNGKELWEKIE